MLLIKKTSQPILHPLWQYLSQYNVVELKTAQDKIEPYDLGTLVSYGLGVEQRLKLSSEKLSLWLLLPQLTPTLLKRLHSPQPRTLTPLLEGVSQTTYREYPLFVVETNHLPLSPHYFSLKLFAQKNIPLVLQSILEEGKASLIKEVLPIVQQLYEKQFQEVMEIVMKTSVKRKRSTKKLFQIMLDALGEKQVIELVGKERFLSALGEEEVIRSLGEERVIISLGEEKLFQKLVQNLGKEQMKKWLEEEEEG